MIINLTLKDTCKRRLIQPIVLIMDLIRRTFTSLDEEMLILLYKALVRPHLEYVSTIWMELLQNKRPNSNSEWIETSNENLYHH